ncbi:Crp/Fnr family transcriptional regulator [Variovorax sp. LT1R20]|uniref:Crp/Fnr family transcriptional regulator n=1 Tax=Variovorax sp. LT1R20 TaxID=3443729 RepID=UPI003F447FCF
MVVPHTESRAADVLDRTPWVKSLGAPARDRLYSDAFLASYEPGQVVARKGALSSSWIGVADGLLKIASVNRSGKIVMFTGIPSGGWIGEGTVLKRELRLYDIVVVRCSTVVHIPMRTFEWLHAHSIEFNHTLIAHLNERLGQYITMMEAGRVSDVVERTARSIATLYNPVLYPNMDSHLRLSQTELGELVGLSRQSIGVALKRLEVEGLLRIEYGGLTVTSVERLRSYEEAESGDCR